MFKIVRRRTIDKEGINYIRPDSLAPALREKFSGVGIDLSDKRTVKALLSLIPVDLIVQDMRVNNIIAIRVVNRARTHKFRSLSNNVLALIHSGCLISPAIIKSVGRLPGSPLRGFNFQQISVLIGAWLHDKLNDHVFTVKNILLWGGSVLPVRSALSVFVGCGYVQKLNDKEVFHYSRKMATPSNKGKKPDYYIITKDGHRALKGYFKLFAKKVEGLTGESWDVPLLEIIKSKDKD